MALSDIRTGTIQLWSHPSRELLGAHDFRSPITACAPSSDGVCPCTCVRVVRACVCVFSFSCWCVAHFDQYQNRQLSGGRSEERLSLRARLVCHVISLVKTHIAVSAAALSVCTQ